MKAKRAVVAMFILVGVNLIVAAVALLPGAFETHMKGMFVGEEHVFAVDEHPPDLSDALALRFAWMTLESDGFDTNEWQPIPDDRSVAPDRKAAEFLRRNTLDPNQGTVTFRDQRGIQRVVRINLNSNQISTCVVIPK